MQTPTRILLLGDSITQGSAGDWTWRYRLWQHLTEDAVSFDLVGYRDDLRDEIAHTFGNQDYLDPAFDRDHASRWGMTLGELDVPVDDLMADHQPDVVVVELGDNDLDAGDSAAGGRRRPGGSRRRRALGRTPTSTSCSPPTLGRPYHRRRRRYNALMADLVDELDSVDSRVVLADAAAGYDESQDTFDGAHPNSHGELKIAAAVEDALSEIGIGTPADRPLPDLPRGPRVPPVLTRDRDPARRRAVVGAVTRSAEVRGLAARRHRRSALDEGRRATSRARRTRRPAWRPATTSQLQTRPFKGFWIAQPDAWSNIEEVVVPAPSRIMLLGDSVTIGSTGDWTWRYRLWKHLAATGAAGVDLVGSAQRPVRPRPRGRTGTRTTSTRRSTATTRASGERA